MCFGGSWTPNDGWFFTDDHLPPSLETSDDSDSSGDSAASNDDDESLFSVVSESEYVWDDDFSGDECEKVSGDGFDDCFSDGSTSDIFAMHFVQVCMLIGILPVLITERNKPMSAILATAPSPACVAVASDMAAAAGVPMPTALDVRFAAEIQRILRCEPWMWREILRR
jgi:hypothetical protein